MSDVTLMAEKVEESSHSRFYRYWPASVTFIVGWALAAIFGGYIGSRIHNHDLAVCMAFIASSMGGIAAGLVAAMVFIRRNP